MSCEFVILGSAAGDIIADIWDGVIVNNAKWSVHDAAAGTNHKVYHCDDSGNNVDFYVSVDNNYVGYAIIELWEGWNAGTHVGIGDSFTDSSGHTCRQHARAGTYVIYNDHRIITVTGWNNLGTYIGQLKRFDTTKNMPVYIGGSDNTTNWFGALGYYEVNSYSIWRALWNHVGTPGTLIYSFAYNDSNKRIKTMSGGYAIHESVIYCGATGLCLGRLDGVMHLFNTNNQLSNMQHIHADDGRWLAVGGNYTSKYWALVRLA